MKFRVTLKDPDGFSESIRDAIDDEFLGTGLPADEREALYEVRSEKVHKAMDKWFEFSEYITIEFDTDLGTATVVPRK